MREAASGHRAGAPADRSSFDSLDDRTFEKFSSLIERNAGISFDRKKKEILRLHLKALAQSAGCRDFQEYLERVEDDSNDSELQRLCEAVAVHQTEFFRNLPQFEALEDVMRAYKAEVAVEKRRFVVWSAGCSSGEEPYSIAMVAAEVFGDDLASRVAVVATDLSEPVLHRARRGLYSEKSAESVPERYRKRYLRSAPGGRIEIAPSVASVVTFHRHNLIRDPLPRELRGGADVIFCRNVTIYFSFDALRKSISVFQSTLRPSGYLFLGHSESLLGIDHGLELVDLGDTFAYRRPEEPPAVVGPQPWTRPLSRLETISQGAIEEVEGYVRGERALPSDLGRSGGVSATAASVSESTRLDAEIRPASRRRSPSGTDREERPSGAPGSSPRTEGARLKEVVAAAQGLLEKGQPGAARRLIERELTRHATAASLHFLMGSALHIEGREDEAARAFSRAIYCDSRFSLAYFYRGAVLESIGKAEAALRDFKAAARLLREDPLGKWDPYLESMSHDQLIEVAEEKVVTLSASGDRQRAR